MYPNLFIQILIGIPLEMVHTWRVLVIYGAGAIGGCLAHSVIVPSSGLVGGSGGFYAFYTAHIATVIMVSVFVSATSAFRKTAPTSCDIFVLFYKKIKH